MKESILRALLLAVCCLGWGAHAAPPNVLLLISDDGCGFDPATLHDTVLRQHSFGLSSIYHRLINLGGEMEIDSEPGNGTTVTLSVPYSLAAKEYQVP